ncbi:hypothetical protein CVIRNUC_009072 [Coccomyxa viridis]|uniref:Uncharacterized protein n=1 Tax=Coccomyxa viridis TaxID=1274662 RepID=A0AAV1IHC9_9CHLO|nr:hypothetical protein CVIRNUC_009072 [Coccomyxa viridis]
MSRIVSQIRTEATPTVVRGVLPHTHYIYSPNSCRWRTLQLRRATEGKSAAADDEELLLRDIERYKQRQQAPISQGRSGDQDLNGPQPSQSGGNAVKDVLDKVLIADFFFVCAALAWLVAGAGAKTVLNNSVLIDAWFPLWQWVFQPAIGTLMLGALVSGAVGRLQKESNL